MVFVMNDGCKVNRLLR